MRAGAIVLPLAAFVFAVPAATIGQQVPDSAFDPPIANPAFELGTGPVVCVDHVHARFHRIDDRYLPFARLLRRDGYVVRAVEERAFDSAALAGCRIVVVANAAVRDDPWSLPTPPAFSVAHETRLVEWVAAGGSLLLVADHMPFAGAIAPLAARFGVQFMNGFSFDRISVDDGGYRFRRSDGSLAEHPITSAGPGYPIDSVLGGVGSAFQAPGWQPLMVFGPTAYMQLPEVAWEFPDGTPQFELEGWLQGAVRGVGEGRVAVIGEAAMLTAQLAGPARQPMGMNHPAARQNPAFVRNLLYWLAGE